MVRPPRGLRYGSRRTDLPVILHARHHQDDRMNIRFRETFQILARCDSLHTRRLHALHLVRTPCRDHDRTGCQSMIQLNGIQRSQCRSGLRAHRLPGDN